MTKRILKLAAILGISIAIGGLAYLQGYSDRGSGSWLGFLPTASAQERQKVTPTGEFRDPNVYYPGTEALAPDEMRVIACGTGMPTARESQAATCFLVELGNGDKFIFDGGTGSGARVASMRIPYDYLIQTMDVVRSVEVPIEGDLIDNEDEPQTELVALFTEISVGDAP